MSSSVAYRIIVEGKVQGVFYRASTNEKAESLKLKGWVRNMPDGKVEIVVEGEKQNVDELLNWCKKGPILANVTHIHVEEIESQKFKKFEIKY